jgi:hypothetical protein
MKSHLSILSLSCWAAGVLLRKSLPIPICSRVFPAPSYSNFRVSRLIFRSLIHFQLILLQGDRHGTSFSFLQMDNHFPQNICWRGCLFSIKCFWQSCQKWGGYSCVDSYLDLLFCSTGLHVCFYASTMLFLLLLLCNVVWSRVLWYLQHCFFCWVLPWLFVASYVFKWTLEYIFQSLWC